MVDHQHGPDFRILMTAMTIDGNRRSSDFIITEIDH